MKYNAVIFDMDGLLFDTELVYYEATQVVADKMGTPLFFRRTSDSQSCRFQ